ncbi:hypothetical protein [Salipiger abyssi]|uniref:hypothetical protein n=1 Tax=Salipiger abyssi TaxID=1250539 RepID=UPI001A8F80E6|nr:hypothetical protein [Salipiger abyssi]MBN9890568.1 hypothetical protein [Salipiger abyssi]
MAAPILLLVPKGLAYLGAALGLTGKAVILSAAALKAAAIGTAFIVKGVAFTKTGAMILTVAGGGIAYATTTDATMETMSELGYVSDSHDKIPVIEREIYEAVESSGIYTVRYCEENGQKIIVQQNHYFCPHDGSTPKEGQSFQFTDEIAEK